MKVRFTNLMQIDNEDLEKASTNGFARFAGINVGYLHRIKRNQVVISESMYNKIITLLTNYLNVVNSKK